jgi:pyruvate/2-oxoglutarate dehydrogenase complex dihydrolipoamide acyltransferase (E2) component
MSENRNQNSSNSSTKRAEELLTRTGQTVGMFASMAGLRLARIGAFAREEFEDMWAEAQDLRRAQGSGPSKSAQSVNKSAETADETAASREGAQESPEKGSAGTGGQVTEDGTGAIRPTTEGQEARPEEVGAVKATDSARTWAEKLGVDLRTVEGTGFRGAITVGDVRKKSREDKG